MAETSPSNNIKLEQIQGQLIVVLSRLLAFCETHKGIYIMDIAFQNDIEYGEWTVSIYYRNR